MKISPVNLAMALSLSCLRASAQAVAHMMPILSNTTRNTGPSDLVAQKNEGGLDASEIVTIVLCVSFVVCVVCIACICFIWGGLCHWCNPCPVEPARPVISVSDASDTPHIVHVNPDRQRPRHISNPDVSPFGPPLGWYYSHPGASPFGSRQLVVPEPPPPPNYYRDVLS